jgi:uncharacterized protein YjbI with pentapeptide repeats
MANPEHLKILKQGVEVWNKWREENRDVLPDLVAADRVAATLSGVNLTGADLSRAKLTGADLVNANFTGANLTDVLMATADLTNANLTGVNLAGARLIFVDLTNANLAGANLSNALLWDTDFGDVDLSEAKRLEKARHLGPSRISIGTIYKSKGKIPEAFLRGAGVPDNLLEYIPSLIGAAFQFYSCFISHSSKDERFCERLYADLKAAHIRTWYFPEDARWGEPVWGEPVWGEIDRSIKLYDKLVVVCSENSLQSGPVPREIDRALNKEDREKASVLFPLRIDDYIFRKWEHPRKDDVLAKVIGDFSNWERDAKTYEADFKKLVKALNKPEHSV